MSLSNAVDNGQTEAEAPHLSTAIRFQPIERKHDVVSHIFGDARTVVVNCDTDLVAFLGKFKLNLTIGIPCLLYTSPSPRDKRQSRMPSSA